MENITNAQIAKLQFAQLQQQLNKRVRKLTNKHKSNIITIMLTDLQHVANWLLANDASFINDVVYNINAFNAFNNTSNVAQLYSTVYAQDTFVREYFANTLNYISDNKLA